MSSGAWSRVLPSDRVDAAFTAVLSLAALLALEATYRGAGLWLAGVAAVLAGLIVAVTVIALGGGSDLVALGLVLGYTLGCGAVLGEASPRAWVAASLEGWRLLTTTHPPVDASGAALLPVVQLGLAAAGAGVTLAMRSRSAAAPLAPLTILLVAALALSRSEPVSVLLHGVGFAVASLAWVRVRTGQADVAEDSSTPGRGRLLAAGAMVALAALVAAPLGGATSSADRLVLRTVLPAYDVADLPTPLDRFRDYTRRRPPPEGNVHDEELLRVRGAPAGTRVRFAALDAYDGSRWSADNDTDPQRVDDRFLRLSSTLDNPAAGDRARVEMRIGTGWALPWVPTAGALQGLDVVADGEADLGEDLRYDPATQTAVTTDRVAPGVTYVLDTVLAESPVTGDLEPSTAVDEDLYAAAAFLDPAVLGWSLGAGSPVDAVLRVAEQLRSAGFYGLGAGHSEPRLGQGFVLSTPSVGNDEQYAAAMALMANRLRVPARVVVGAVLPPDGVVEGKDVSAWVELRAADGSWHTLATDRFMGRRPPPPGAAPQGGRPERIFPEETPEERNPDQRPEPQRPPDRPDREPDRTREQPDDGASEPESGPGVWPWLGLVLLLALPGVVPALKWWRRRRRRSAARVSERYAGAWLELVDQARDLGRPVPAGLTRPAQARTLGVGVDLATEADLRIFGSEEPAPAEAEAFWALVEDERSGLTARYPAWQRLRAALSPASLRRR